MSIRPFRDIKRKKTKRIKVGKVDVGDGAPISVQSMTNTLTTNIKESVNQINELDIDERKNYMEMIHLHFLSLAIQDILQKLNYIILISLISKITQ